MNRHPFGELVEIPASVGPWHLQDDPEPFGLVLIGHGHRHQRPAARVGEPVEILASADPLHLLDAPATGHPEALPDDPHPSTW